MQNIQLITLDSCRYDTARIAHTPNLNSISKLLRGESYANYTYPSHQALFMGMLPRIASGKYLEGYDKIWRSINARSSSKKVFEYFIGSNIIAHYKHKGHKVLGYGGVEYFNTHLNSSSLPNYFDQFEYFGMPENVSPIDKLPRPSSSFPLGNIDKIVEDIDGTEPYFLFINCPETHTPYDVPGTDINSKYINLISRLYEEERSKHYYKDQLPFTEKEILVLKKHQIQAMEWIDLMIGDLFSKLPKTIPTLTIVLGDHGEEFGEHGRFGHVHNSEEVLFVPMWCGLI